MNWDTCFCEHINPMQPYVPGLRGSEVRKAYQIDTEILKLSSNESPYPPFPKAVEAAAEIAHHANLYPDGSARILNELLADECDVEPNQIAIGNGSNELLINIAQVLLNEGDEVVFAWPSFIVYRIGCQLAKAKAVETKLDLKGAFDLSEILDAITEKTKIVFLCNPNNPTGASYSQEDFDAFMEHVPAHVLVVIDEAYIEFADDELCVDALKYFDGKRGLVVLRTFSKAYALAGARVGYGLMPAPLVDAINKVREPFNVNVFAQAMAYYSMIDREELAWRVAENKEVREKMQSALDEMGAHYYKSQTNFVWFSVKDVKQASETLLKRGIISRAFPSGDGIRLGIPSIHDVDAVIAGLQELNEASLLAVHPMP